MLQRLSGLHIVWGLAGHPPQRSTTSAGICRPGLAQDASLHWICKAKCRHC